MRVIDRYMRKEKDSLIRQRTLIFLFDVHMHRMWENSDSKNQPHKDFDETKVGYESVEREILNGNHVIVPYENLEPHIRSLEKDEAKWGSRKGELRRGKLRWDSYSEIMGPMSNPEGYSKKNLLFGKSLIKFYANGSASITPYGIQYVKNNFSRVAGMYTEGQKSEPVPLLVLK